jgi:hypothetical protein
MVGLRLYVCLSSLLSSYLLYNGYLSVGHVTVVDKLLAVAALALVATIGLTDLLVNDLLSERWDAKSIKEFRHNGYATLAAANLALIYLAASRGTESALLIRLAIDGFMSLYVAIKDVQIRFVDPRKESLTHRHVDRSA